MRILVVEDEHKIANAIKKGLELESFAVDVAYDGDSGLTEVTHEEYDLVILDRMMPGSVDGTGILETMRKEGNHTPVLLLTAKDRLNDRVEGLNLGADDYLVKPFAFEELLARVRALLRRPQDALDTELRYDNLKLNTTNFSVSRNDTPISLSAKEFALLEYFMRNPDRTLTKDQIMQHVWNYDSDILPNTIEAYVGYLRKKIDRPFRKQEKPLIHTIRGFGYQFGIKS
jgi:DNA-binding response OmpR family regulator